MKDKNIIKMISTIHFILVSIFAFIFSTLFISFIVLQNGIYIDNISYPNIEAKKLYIKWNEKLSIIVKELNLKTQKKDKNLKLEPQKIEDILHEIILFDTIFEKVLIEKIHYNDIEGSFNYLDGGNGYLNLSSSEFKLETSLFFESHLFNIKIDSFVDESKEIKAYGNVILNTYNNNELIVSLKVNVLNNIDLNVYAKTNLDKLTYKIESNNNIENLKPIVDKYASNWEAKWWVRDAINMSSLKINDIHGYLEYDHVNEAYRHLYADAVVNDLKYTYNEKLDVIDTSHTKLEFKNGVLYITPINAYTYKTYLDKSKLNIDFTKEHTIIYLHLLFDGMLNKDLLYLLSVYDINLPFIQNKGKLRTDLKVDIDLNTIDVEAHGSFHTKDAWINYLGLDLHVFDTNVVLHNTNVSVKNMYAKYEDIASSHLDILFNAKKSIGKLNFRIDDVSFKNLDLKLEETKDPLHVEYVINPKQDYVKIANSKWVFDGDSFNVDKMQLPFNFKDLSISIPPTKVYSKDALNAIASGKLLFKPIRANIDLDITKLFKYNTKLNQEQLNLNIIYDDKLRISSDSKISLKTSKDIYNISGLDIYLDNQQLSIKDMNVSIENILQSNLSLEYNLIEDNGHIDINNINISNNIFDEIFKKDTTTRLDIKKVKDDIIIDSKYYDLKYILNDYEWKVSVNSINNIAKESKILQKYFIDNGSFRMGKKYNTSHINFLFKSDYKYAILVKGNNPIHKYSISGKVRTKKDLIDIDVNRFLHIEIDDNIKIKTKNIGFYLNDIINFISELDSDGKKDTKAVYLEAKNSYVFLSKDRHAAADLITFKYINNILTIQLIHKKGKANFEYKNDAFILKGENFEDTFMNELFALSKFKGGRLNFLVAGDKKRYKGLVHIKDSKIMDYKILNNVLAFVNTVPSLLTFRMPGYNKNGLDIDKLYFDFQYKNHIYNISNLLVESKELDIVGKGDASIKNNTIDMDLNLKTKLGSSVSKIPVVGYILLGDDTVSTSLKLNGKLDDPQVTTRVAKDIVVAPWNILKRTFTYPMKLFENDNKKK